MKIDNGQIALGHVHLGDVPLRQIGWRGHRDGAIYPYGARITGEQEPGGFSPIWEHWSEECGHQIRAQAAQDGGTTLTVEDTPKMIREALCAGQAALASFQQPGRAAQLSLLQRLINECDRHRPLGPDGKHGDRHTPTCRCEDVS